MGDVVKRRAKQRREKSVLSSDTFPSRCGKFGSTLNAIFFQSSTYAHPHLFAHSFLLPSLTQHIPLLSLSHVSWSPLVTLGLRGRCGVGTWKRRRPGVAGPAIFHRPQPRPAARGVPVALTLQHETHNDDDRACLSASWKRPGEGAEPSLASAYPAATLVVSSVKRRHQS